ncbi:hypothetical protein LMH87_000893 [Akanthomyces muscarius]|uniref:WD40/YVTN repeat-like-containing domain protein n=2 Tax=Akanthomyces TaxID=150366 RepID=A0A168DJK2_CORDF|nr:hypothetical protein LMH87_000893 [Akanthomyces muscarius]KAJ4155657.1 hypothetical protein LMH87_000893 [Akanthomyces muscarius]OAA72691.1 hypothetical protein LEL_08475 [Akanthomyces lecanii RCEF 1005]
MTQTRIPSLRSIATCLFHVLASVSAAPRRPPKSPFRALQAVPTGLSLSSVITGLYANDTADAQIAIHDMHGNPSWTWSAADVASQSNIPADLLSCIQSVTAVPEAKWADGGRSVLSIYNAAALMITHAPGGDTDKQVTWGVCLNQDGRTNTHSLELVPDGQVAIATTTSSTEATIQVFNVSAGLTTDPSPVQSLNLLPAVHALVWDEQGGLLWGAGSSADPTGASGSSAPALNGYRYTRGPGGGFVTQPTYSYNVTTAVALDTEWADSEYSGWWDGGHDMTGVPGRRQLLLSTDTDLHVFDIDSQTFESGSSVASKYLPGFTPVDSRVGSDGQSLPRSDIKSLSIDGNNNVLYVQAAWQDVTSYQINLLENGQLQPALTYPQQLYRSRWFADTPTWPKARLPPS